MFNLKTKFMLAAALFLVGGVSAVSAQIPEGTALKINVSSSFVIRDKTFEAGEYTVARTPSTADSGTLMILRDAKGKGLIIFDTIARESGTRSTDSQLIFDAIGGNLHLSRIRVRGSNVSLELPRSAATDSGL